MKYTQLQRFHLIDEMLYLNPDGLSSVQMLEAVNVALKKKKLATISLRQLQMDLRELKEQMGAPISSGRAQKKIRYSNAAFCIFNQSLSNYKIAETEANPLTGRLNWLRLQVQYMEKCRSDEQLMEVMDFEDNLRLANINCLPILLRAIINRTVLRLKYATGFSEQTKIRIVHPYFLHQYNQRWYLYALFREKDNLKEGKKPEKRRDIILPFAVDRITDVSELVSGRVRYISMSIDKLRAMKVELFRHIVGIRNDPYVQPVNLTLSFDFAQKPEGEEKQSDGRLFYNLLKSNPFYDGFSFSNTETCGTAECRIKPNPELLNNLMTYAHAAYISDEGIRNDIIRRAQEILSVQNAAPSQSRTQASIQEA